MTEPVLTPPHPPAFTRWRPLLLSLALTVTVKKIWQAWQVSPSQPRNGGRESCNFWSQLLKFCLFSFILLSRQRIEWKLPTVLLSYGNNVPWPACFSVPSHPHIIYSLYFAVHSNLLSYKKKVLTYFSFCRITGFCAAEVCQQGHLLRDSSQCLDKTLDAGDKSNACLWECERTAIQPIMQSCTAFVPKWDSYREWIAVFFCFF